MHQDERYVRWFDTLNNADVPLVGGKNASLGEMVRNLKDHGIPVPHGFATTAAAYWEFLKANNLTGKIEALLEDWRQGEKSLEETGKAIRRLFLRSQYPQEIPAAISIAYQELGRRYNVNDVDVAVRSSATAEDLPDASFAGQQESFLNVTGDHELMEACRRCYASLFTDRAMVYRQEKGFDHLRAALSIGGQKMVRSDKAGSGVMFTIDTETGFRDVAVINAAWGLGENVVQGTVNPDEYMVFKPLLTNPGFTPIIEKNLGSKEKKLVYAVGGTKTTRNLDTGRDERNAFVLADAEILTLARWAVAIEQHYDKPMDIEWAKDGPSGRLFIVQARPETVQSRREAGYLRTYEMQQEGKRLLSGLAIGEAIAAGRVCRIRSAADIARFKDNAILVTEMTDPDWVPIMKRARGIAKIAASQYPEPVIVRMSDFKTNEYANLIGGQQFEFQENNPMLGFRGASRYYSDRYRDGFALECRAVKRVREEMGLANVIVMIPFCRTLQEADRVLQVLGDNGLKRGEAGLLVYVMAEIPSNVILAEKFAERFDGFSIGSNDLTQLVLGVDRDSSELSELFDERDEAVTRMIQSLITSAHQAGRKVGICGQAPSDYPEFAEFLVSCGIDSISLNPDSVIKVIRHVAEAEG